MPQVDHCAGFAECAMVNNDQNGFFCASPRLVILDAARQLNACALH
jgi:hypothetical protein